MDEIGRHGAILSLLLAGIGLGSILKLYGRKYEHSLSTHAAKQKPSYIIFLFSLIASAACFYLFSLWFQVHFNPPEVLTVSLLITITLSAVAAIVPESGGRSSQIHGAAAWSMAVGMLMVVGLLAFLGSVSGLAKAGVGLCLAYMCVTFLLFLFVKRSKKYFLIFQSTYVVSFYAAFLCVAYL